MKILLAFAFSILSYNSFGETNTSCFEVKGMTCASCSLTLKLAVKKLDGVGSVRVDVKENRAEVTFDDSKTNPDLIDAAIDSTGYQAEKIICNK